LKSLHPPQAVDSQVQIDLSNPQKQRVARTKGPSNSLMAMMKVRHRQNPLSPFFLVGGGATRG
jgi:hypothetical protein